MIALTFGVGLITTFSVVTASAKAVAFSQLDRDYPIDYLVSPLQTAGIRADATLPDAVTSQLRRQPQLSTVAPQWEGRATLGRHGHTGVTALDASAYGRAFTPQPSSGSTDSLAAGTGGVALYAKLAGSLHVKLGDTVALLAPHRTERLKVVAISSVSFLGDDALVSAADFARDFEPAGPVNVLIKAAPGAAAGQSLAAVNQALALFPLTRVQSVADYKSQLTSAIDGLLAIFDGLLGIAIVIALFGIANTLSLSAIERTQESGLLRALGLTRGQLRRMLSAEALLIGVMGGAVGVVIGSGFGSALSETVVRAGGAGSSLSYPVLTILLYVALAGLAGLAAGVLPARRAAKTSVIEAITRP